MVGLDLTQIIDVIDHHAMRLRLPVGGQIGVGVDRIEQRTIAEMETRDRIKRQA